MSDTPPDVDMLTGPCAPWTTAELVLACPVPGIESDDPRVALAVDAASDVCFQLGGRRWPGICADEVLPEGYCACGCRPSAGLRCRGVSKVELGSYPIVTVESVLLDGVELVQGVDYRLVDRTWLVRLGGNRWPCCNLPDVEDLRLVVSFTFGQEPPAMGQLAATALGRELLLGMCDNEDCVLDRRVTSVVRENVRMDLALPGLVDALGDGNTGIPEVDLFVHAHNPNRLQREARFIGLDGGVSRINAPTP